MEEESKMVLTKTVDTTPVEYNPIIGKWLVHMEDPYE